MEERDVVTGLRGALVERADDSSNGVLCGIIDELKCDVVLLSEGVLYVRYRDEDM